MTEPEFDALVAVALGVCRSAARVELPIGEMLEHVTARIADGEQAILRGDFDEHILAGQPSLATGDLNALRVILTLVGEVAAIGARLPPESRPVRVPAPPKGGSFPVPANVLREA